MAGIYSDCSTRKIIMMSICSVVYATSVAMHHLTIVGKTQPTASVWVGCIVWGLLDVTHILHVNGGGWMWLVWAHHCSALWCPALAAGASANTVPGRISHVHLCPRSCRSGILPTRLHSDGKSQRHAGLHSVGCGDLAVLTTATELSKRSFHVVTPVIWNSLPGHLCSPSTSKEQFRCGL